MAEPVPESMDLHAKEKCDYAVNKQVCTCNARNNIDYHSYVHDLELYNSKPVAPGCIFYNRLPHSIK
jgi:hypothetical protein